MAQNEIVYHYDGSFSGFLCCVFRAYEKREEPFEICRGSETLFQSVYVDTEEDKAARVAAWVGKTFGKEFTDIVTLCYLSEERGAEADLLRLIRLAHRQGTRVLRDLCDPLVIKMKKLAKSVEREAHRMIEFLRFSDYDGGLTAVINPKYFVLPLIAGHFEQRFPNETYFIYDEAHQAALSHFERKSEIFSVESFVAEEPTEEEKKFRKLWKLFYDTVEIKERRNLKLRMQHMPKRYWKNVTELNGREGDSRQNAAENITNGADKIDCASERTGKA